MSATLIKGKPIAERIRAQVAEDVAAIGHIGLVTVLVGDDPASDVYIRLKHKAAVAAGIDATDLRLPDETSEADLLAKVEELDADPQVDAILVQLPLPKQIDEAKVIRALAPAKDVDGFHPINAGQLYLGEPTLVPATPRGVMAMLAEHQVELSGARAVVIGRSAIVGKPMAHLLLQQNATVTICHSRTKDLATAHARGRRARRRGRRPRHGDARHGEARRRRDRRRHQPDRRRDRRRRRPGAAEVAGYLTPVPGGVGPMTIACLLENAVRCARYRRGELAYPA